jgi:Heterokaryon incompatibility protein (HET)
MNFSESTKHEGGDACKFVIKTQQTKYVALSHIWADGIVNEQSNKLPRRLLNKVQSFVDTLYLERSKHESSLCPQVHIPFWIDSCGVPVEAQYADARELGLIQMTDVYRDADKVLVWDRELLSNPSRLKKMAQITLISA